ncbi:MAG: tetratricopeptide repeat protein [Candidatus Eremiobacteraeota bacterium]|nr:tetratricopeptide repeat protein [Candidatus Eremiobacteraeota bacterium]
MKKAGVILLAIILIYCFSCAREKKEALPPDVIEQLKSLDDTDNPETTKKRLNLLTTGVPGHPLALRAYRDHIRHLVNMGKEGEARALLDMAGKTSEKIDPGSDSSVPVVLNDMANMAEKLGDIEHAESLLNRALKGAKKGSTDHVLILGNLGQVLRLEGNYHKALTCLAESVRLSSGAGLPGQERARLMHCYAECLRATGKFRDAGPIYEKALEIRKTGDPVLYATLLNDYSAYLQDVSEYDDAEKIAKTAIRIHKKYLPAGDPDISRDMINLAEIALLKGNYKKAIDLINFAEQNLDEDSPDLASALNVRAHALREIGKYYDSRCSAEKALEIRQKKLGQDHPEVAIIMNTLASSLRTLGKGEDAGELLSRAIDIRISKVGADDPYISSLMCQQAEIFMMDGKWNQAENTVRKALNSRAVPWPASYRNRNNKITTGPYIKGTR